MRGMLAALLAAAAVGVARGNPTVSPTVAPPSLPPGQWELVFRQTAEPGGGWFRSEDEWVVNAGDPASAPVSIPHIGLGGPIGIK